MANTELTHEPSSLDRKARSFIAALQPASGQRPSASRTLARGLGWFSLGLGAVELLAARPLARGIGLAGHESLLRAYGLREIVNGLGLLASRQPGSAASWVGARVAGDALDLTTLAAAAVAPRPRSGHPVAALFAVAGVTLLDLICAKTLQQEAHAARQTTDYSGRGGLGGDPRSMRGAALENFDQPPDMRISSGRMMTATRH
ncbi:MAG TPA: hypothetical protein VFR90_11955 [Methylibium sp.]|uniref:hypothetical protein n=1 Tax=Methylibium sp. TaxID=2067992 RepID=UPI002DB69EDD|nr:hypothetical protein [Methylibium sp.]HEU4459829.1 hypothetical protein [Methylibium sp.]